VAVEEDRLIGFLQVETHGAATRLADEITARRAEAGQTMRPAAQRLRRAELPRRPFARALDRPTKDAALAPGYHTLAIRGKEGRVIVRVPHEGDLFTRRQVPQLNAGCLGAGQRAAIRTELAKCTFPAGPEVERACLGVIRHVPPTELQAVHSGRQAAIIRTE